MADEKKEPAVEKRSPAASEEELDNALGHETLEYKHGFCAGVRWAEKLHKITE